jgi:hypothetical protein
VEQSASYKAVLVKSYLQGLLKKARDKKAEFGNRDAVLEDRGLTVLYECFHYLGFGT